MFNQDLALLYAQHVPNLVASLGQVERAGSVC
jgi:hypothetical protein